MAKNICSIQALWLTNDYPLPLRASPPDRVNPAFQNQKVPAVTRYHENGLSWSPPLPYDRAEAIDLHDKRIRSATQFRQPHQTSERFVALCAHIAACTSNGAGFSAPSWGTIKKGRPITYSLRAKYMAREIQSIAAHAVEEMGSAKKYFHKPRILPPRWALTPKPNSSVAPEKSPPIQIERVKEKRTRDELSIASPLPHRCITRTCWTTHCPGRRRAAIPLRVHLVTYDP
ncbi:hypothetical protein EVAR_97603_1 [Eumeta japonica]|uniref:Uncharacterized protein n=1 Tax=Eumeta variegata TaxID=151549 RepID=A0A4C1XI65_EUMVA|nr:hypothetical protein EVAR_97603_1 [Eumeta japonica]